ncbi:MAG: hypothetical protein ACP5Q0_05990, partial [Halothiobacillus sp.]
MPTAPLSESSPSRRFHPIRKPAARSSLNILPKSLFGQILLALILGIVAAFTLSLSLLLTDRARLGERLLGDYAVQRIAQIIQIQNEATPAERRQLARWLSAPPTRLLARQAWRE